MSAFKMESCFGADINVGYFDVEEILDIFGIKREVKNNPRVKRLIKLHGAKERIVAIVMRQVAIDLLKPDLEGSFLPYDGYFNDDLLLTSRRERLYDAQERFLMLCYSLANGRSVRSLKKLHAGLTTKEWREKHKRSVSLYKYFRQELNDHTRDYILSYKAGMEEESSTKEKASPDNTQEPSLEEQIPVLSEADSVSSLDVQSSEPKLILREKLEPTKFDKEITVALKILAEGRELLIHQVSNMNKGKPSNLMHCILMCTE